MPVKWWRPAGRLMLFERLDTSWDRVPVYTIGWRIEDNPDQWTRRFLAFKADDNDRHFLGGASVLREAVGEVLRVERLAPAETALSAALSSRSESTNPNAPLCRAGKWIAEGLGLQWKPDIFEKPRHRSLHSIQGGAERDAEVRGKYRCKKLNGVKTLIILDDFVTRGATLGDMQRAMAQTNPRVRVLGLALAKNERESYASQFDQNVNNDHIPGAWDELWAEKYKKGRQ